MFFVYILICFLLICIVLWPYERVAILRIRAVRRIAALCRAKNINFKVINHAYPFSKNSRNEFDFIIRIDKTLIPVKLFSSTERKTTMILDGLGKICIVRKYREPLSRDGKKKVSTIKSFDRLPTMRISKKIVGDRFRCFPVILNEPAFGAVLFKDNSGNVSSFYDGSHKVAGCNFVDSNVLADLIEMYK